jgi:hypothetical protein
MTTRQLKALVKWAKSQGLTHLKLDGVEFALNPTTAAKNAPQSTETPFEVPNSTDPSAVMPSDSDMLLWSTGAFDEVTQSRKTETV